MDFPGGPLQLLPHMVHGYVNVALWDLVGKITGLPAPR
jgi:L-alanine-DL-glutamate epimerase-like enolase superfamily enzyme